MISFKYYLLFFLILLKAIFLSVVISNYRSGFCPIVYQVNGFTMGTNYSMYIEECDKINKNQLNSLKYQIDIMLERINNIMSTYRDYSTISIFNKYKNNNMFFVDSEMSYIVRNALRIKRLFNGLFDITLAPLIDLWGFDKINVFDIPKNNIIKLYQNIIGLNKVIVVDKYLQKTHSEIKINLSGIAKGYGVDVIYQFIQNLGFKNFMIEIGGEIRVSNNRFKEWKIGILNPCIDNDKEKIVSIVKLKSGSLATSGTYLNYFTNNFKKYSHILNPNTGYPVDNNVLSVSIIAPSCMVADALCTVALILEENSFYNNIKYWKYVGAIFIYGNDKFSIGISKS